jgi:hypothetical protein
LIEVGTELSMAERVRQVRNTTRSMVGAICESRIFQSGGFVGSYDKPPFTSFVVLAVGLVAVLMMLYTDLPERLRLPLAG